MKRKDAYRYMNSVFSEFPDFVQEYIGEAEHQDGYGYWSNFRTQLELLQDCLRYKEGYDQMHFAKEFGREESQKALATLEQLLEEFKDDVSEDAEGDDATQEILDDVKNAEEFLKDLRSEMSL